MRDDADHLAILAAAVLAMFDLHRETHGLTARKATVVLATVIERLARRTGCPNAFIIDTFTGIDGVEMTRLPDSTDAKH